MKNIFYIPENSDEIFGWSDFLDFAKGNSDYAISLIDRCDWQHPSTLVEEDIKEGEIISYNNQYFLTRGNDFLSGNEAKKFYYIALSSKDYKELPQVRGYFKENSMYIAFDNLGGEFFVESFDRKMQAIKYAKGEIAENSSGELF